MEASEYPYYGLGIIAYTVACSDGTIQAEERRELREIVSRWSEEFESDFDIAEIIFTVLKQVPMSPDKGYEEGMKYIRLGSNHLSEKMKEMFVFMINDVAHAFPPVTDKEKSLVKKFREDIEDLA